MKTTSVKELEEFKQALQDFCEIAGYEIAGTCDGEGIYGEITIKKVGEDNGWTRWEEYKFNFVP